MLYTDRDDKQWHSHAFSPNMTFKEEDAHEKDANIWKNEQNESSEFWSENQISASSKHLKMNPASNNTYSKHFYIKR